MTLIFGQSQTKKKFQVKKTQLVDTFYTQKTPDRLKEIVSNISSINVVQSKHIGMGGTESENYKNYLKLRETATIKELLELTDNKNSVVACYAAIALADTSYQDLKTIFKKFLFNQRYVETQSGCIGMTQKIYYEVYAKYWSKVEVSLKSTDKILFQLDSLAMKSKDTFLQSLAIKNRPKK